MRIRHILIVTIALFIPGLLPAPDLPPGENPFLMVQRMRTETIKKDNAQYHVKYFRFKKLLAQFESRNNWKEYSRYGYIGKYQFGQNALVATGYGHISLQKFKDNPSVFPEQDQEKAMDLLLKINESVMKESIERYVGFIFYDSIPITRTGILAAAHLAGPANVKEFLDSFGQKNVKDRMGTYLSDYVYHFSR